MDRYEREYLEGRLSDRRRDARDMLAFIRCIEKRAKGNPDRDAYEDWAARLRDDLADFFYASSFKAIRQELDDAEQSDAHAEMMEQRRAYFSTQGV
jgi:hypothetical protein